jgi:hypothetical protein
MASQKEAEANLAHPVQSRNSDQADENYDFYRQHQGLEYTPEEAKKVLRKIDLVLIPILFLIYMLQVRFQEICSTK